ncbi:MAG: S24 family peptidase [Trichocoleus desertorum ATA4-8-CV12]|jgi:phage repressor protein C with HTH and peptisase S24 domain|nr:S24 family peptidase [Trichocoleus desertorum ATA4-8-CV12]
MPHSKKKQAPGRPSTWGNLEVVRPRLPLNIVTEIDYIRDQFTDPEDAHQYILGCLNGTLKMQRMKLYDFRISATPGITSPGGDASYEEIEVPSILLKNPNKSFLARAAGDSMKDAGIPDGAYIVAKEMNPLFESPPDRAIVTAVVNDQILIKRYRYRYNKHELLSENRRKNYPPIVISSDMSDHDSIFIFGVFERVIPDSMMRIINI